jgi:putative two-component system response regulator
MGAGETELVAAAAGTHALVVDDDPQVRRLLELIMRRNGFECDSAADVADGRRMLAADDFDLLLCDLSMPGGSGLEIIEELRRVESKVATVMITGTDDPVQARKALAAGVYAYVTKPFTENNVLIAVATAMGRRDQDLAGDLRRRHRDEGRMLERLTRTIELRSEETAAHLDRVSAYSGLIAGRLGLPDAYCAELSAGSRLHDIGKVAIPDAILNKPGPLTPAERATIERHAEIGGYILSGSNSSVMALATTVARTHHERWDGSGYPNRLRGHAIPLEGRIVAVADVFDALTSDRVYRQALGHAAAVDALVEERGLHFDPHVLDCFLEAIG